MQKSNQPIKVDWIPILLIIYNFCANLSNDIYLPSMPALANQFGQPANTLQLTMTAWFCGVAVPQLFFGPLTERFGRRPILFLGGLCFICASIVCALATNLQTLILGRLLQGVGVCSLNVTNFAILVDLYPIKDRIKIINKINMCSIVAPLLGPLLGGYILAYLGWRYNFIVLFLVALLALVGLWLKLPESNLNLNKQALNLKNIYLNYFRLLKNRNFIQHLLPYCFMLGGIIVFLTSAPFIIIDQLQVAPEYFGYSQISVFSAYIAGAIYLNRQTNEEAIKRLIPRGIFLVLLSSFSMLFLSFCVKDNVITFVLPMSFYALGFSLCSSSLVSGVMSASSLSHGFTSALLGFGMAISCMFFSFLVSLIYNGTITSIASLLFFSVFLAATSYGFIASRLVPVSKMN